MLNIKYAAVATASSFLASKVAYSHVLLANKYSEGIFKKRAAYIPPTGQFTT